MSAAKPISQLTSGRLLAANTIWNLLGQLLPTAVGLIAVPTLIHGLGVDRFGILSLAWVSIGYFSIFDLGIGRALTKLVAEKLGTQQESSIPPLVWTSLLLMLLLGAFSGLIVMVISPWLTHRALKVPMFLQTETLLTFRLLAISIPLVTVTSGLRGVLEAQQHFRILTLIRIPMSVFSFVGPLMVLPFSQSLVVVIAVLIAGRVAGCVAHGLACFSAMPALRNLSLEASVIKPAISFGGWMTVTNLVGPIMTYMDRFLISAVLSVGMVAFYTAPFDMVTRVLVIPQGLVGVLFPALTLSLVQDRDRTGMLLGRGIKYIFLSMFPIALMVLTLAPESLRLWLGPAFSQNGSSVLRWLAVGVFINAIAQVPFILIQSAGRPDLIAKVEVAQVPVYLVALWLLTAQFGIRGTAIAWTGRIILDAVILFLISDRLLPHKPRLLLKLGLATTGGLAIFCLATIPESLPMKAVFLSLVLLAFAAGGWFWALGSSERVFLTGARTPLHTRY